MIIINKELLVKLVTKHVKHVMDQVQNDVLVVNLQIIFITMLVEVIVQRKDFIKAQKITNVLLAIQLA